MNNIQVIFVWALCWTFAQTIKLPDYIKPCHRYVPEAELIECTLKASRDAIPHIINGDPKYNVPPVDPIFIKELTVQKGSSSVGLKLFIHDAFMRGVKNVDIRSLSKNFDTQNMTFGLYFPEIRIDSIYNVTGKILLLPIEGYGNGTIVLKKVSAIFNYEWDYKKKGGKEYYHVKNSKLTFEPEKLSIHLENLFHGNKLLGDNMNRFINENWKEILKDVGPVLGDAVGQYIRQILNNIFDLVPRENVYNYDPV